MMAASDRVVVMRPGVPELRGSTRRSRTMSEETSERARTEHCLEGATRSRGRAIAPGSSREMGDRLAGCGADHLRISALMRK